MAVLAILAIVSSLALSAYRDQIRKSRRADATASLMANAQLLERCFTRLYAYDADACPALMTTSDRGFYTLTATVTATTYTLTAAPSGDQGSDPCGSYTLDHLGNRTPASGTHRCWGS